MYDYSVKRHAGAYSDAAEGEKAEVLKAAKEACSKLQEKGWEIVVYAWGVNRWRYYLKRGGFCIYQSNAEKTPKAYANPQKAYISELARVCKFFNSLKEELTDLTGYVPEDDLKKIRKIMQKHDN